MWIKKKNADKTEKPSGIYASCGFKRTISILLVLCLVASQAFALPNKAGLFQRMDQTSLVNSQTNSSMNLNEANGNLVLSPQQQKQISNLLDESLMGVIQIEGEDEHQASLTELIEKSTMMFVAKNEELNAQLADRDKTIAKQEGQIKELRGDKIQKTFDVYGTYNLDLGWGAGADVGLKVGHMTTKIGAEALVADLMNPNKLKDLNTYTFKAGIGFEW